MYQLFRLFHHYISLNLIFFFNFLNQSCKAKIYIVFKLHRLVNGLEGFYHVPLII